MARQEAVMKAGYYPIAPEVIELIASKIPVPAEGHRMIVLDPCMGKGAALKTLADSFKARKAKVTPYGVELSAERYKEAVELFGDVRGLECGGAEFLDMTSDTVNVLFLNPPFDDSGKEQERWIRMMTPLVTPGGIMIFITTEDSAMRYTTREMINSYYKNAKMFKFPDAHRPYNEVVVVGVRREGSYRAFYGGEDYFRPDRNAPELTAETPDFPAPVTTEAPRHFKVTVPNLDSILDVYEHSGVSVTKGWTELTRPQALAQRFRPLRKLGAGHIANMIAAGAFRGLALEDAANGRCLISGYGGKINSPVEKVENPDGSRKEIIHQMPVVRLTVFDLDKNKLIEYSSQEPASLQHFILSNLDLLQGSIHKNFPALFQPETMIHPYLEAASFFASPGMLPGATRVRLKDGRKGRVIAKNGVWKLDINGDVVEVEDDQIAHIYHKMLPAQIIEAAAMAWLLENRSKGAMEIGQMGVGKTATGLKAFFLARMHRYGLMIDPDRKGVITLKDADGNPVKDSIMRHTVVIMAPGHLAAKWKREAEACFRNFKFADGKIKVVIPGKDMRRFDHFDVVSDTEIACQHCGAKKKVLNDKQVKSGTTVREWIANKQQRIACANCKEWLVDYKETPLTDIDEAFKYAGLSVIILPKDKSKLGAEWYGVGQLHGPESKKITHRYAERYQGAVMTEDRVRCPECGEYATYLTKDGREEFILADELAIKGGSTTPKRYCRAVVERPVRDEDGRTVIREHYWLGDAEINEGAYNKLTDEEKVNVKKFYQPEMSKKDKRTGEFHRCGTPLYRFAALAGGEGKQRVELTHYIADKHSHEYDLLADEVHQFKGNTTQGAAMQVLAANANYSLGLTGTPYGGKASSVFYMLYRLFPSFRELFSFGDITSFVDRYGVKDIITTIGAPNEDDGTSSYGGHRRRATGVRKQEANGCVPTIVEMFLPQSAFLTLAALHITLPPRNEHFHWLPIDKEFRDMSDQLHKVRKKAAQKAAMGAPGMMTQWMNAELYWPLSPDKWVKYVPVEIRVVADALRKEGKEAEASALLESSAEIWAAPVPFTEEWPETDMTRQVADQMQKDWTDHQDRSIVYIASQKYYGAHHIYNAAKRRGLNPFILTTPDDNNVNFAAKGTYAKSELEDREEIIADAIKAGFNVLIVNPAIVAEGVDLVQYNKLHVLGLPNWSLYKFAQSLARLHRPGQEKEVDIHFWAYGNNPALGGDNQLQALAVRTMSDKMRGANVVTGDVGSSLAALNERAGDIMTELRDRMLKDKMPEFTDIKDTASFSGETEPMTPLEIAIRDIVEQFEDARLFGADAPEIVLPTDDVMEVFTEQPAASVADISDLLDEEVDLGELELDTEEVMEPEIAEPEPTPEPQSDESLEGLKRRWWQLGYDEALDNIPYSDEWVHDILLTVRTIARQAYSDGYRAGTEEAARIAIQNVPTPQPAPEPEPIVQTKPGDGFGIEEVEPEPELEAEPEVDPFGFILALTDEDIQWSPAVVYEDTDFKSRALPGSEDDIQF